MNDASRTSSWFIVSWTFSQCLSFMSSFLRFCTMGRVSLNLYTLSLRLSTTLFIGRPRSHLKTSLEYFMIFSSMSGTSSFSNCSCCHFSATELHDTVASHRECLRSTSSEQASRSSNLASVTLKSLWCFWMVLAWAFRSATLFTRSLV